MSKVTIACGLQKTYLHARGSSYLGDGVLKFKDRWLDHIKSSKRRGDLIFFTREIFNKDDPFLSGITTRSLVGTDDTHIIDKYKEYIDFIVNVNRYDALYMTSLSSELNKIKPDEITLIGVETHTSILFTAQSLRNRDYTVKVPESLTTASDDYLHAIGITIMSDALGVEVI